HLEVAGDGAGVVRPIGQAHQDLPTGAVGECGEGFVGALAEQQLGRGAGPHAASARDLATASSSIQPCVLSSKRRRRSAASLLMPAKPVSRTVSSTPSPSGAMVNSIVFVGRSSSGPTS